MISISVYSYGWRLLLVGLLFAIPLQSSGQSTRVESDPSVVRILPKNYPLDRIRAPAQEYPWSAVGLVTLLGGRQTCTGTLLAERYVLTAAHCVFLARRFPSEINFLAGYEQDRYVAHSKAKRVLLSPRFREESPSLRAFANDWALIELEKPIGRTAGYLGWAHLDARSFEKIRSAAPHFKVTGYRRDRRFVLTVDHQCQITAFLGSDALLLHECPITGGDSGGPVLLPFRDQLLIVGIDVGVRGKADPYLKRGETREGYAVPSATFKDKLIELGIDAAPIEGSDELTGRLGRAP